MTKLREQMQMNMELKGFSPKTQSAYVLSNNMLNITENPRRYLVQMKSKNTCTI
jgi:hypothetical protein